MREKQFKIDRFTFSMSLEFPEEVGVSPHELQETVVDAIFAYDDVNRLVPGAGLPNNGERLIGTSMGLEKSERFTDNSRAFSRDRGVSVNPHPAAEELTNVVNLSEECRKKIEELETIRARLWNAWDLLISCEEEANFKAQRPKTRRSITTAKKQYESLFG